MLKIKQNYPIARHTTFRVGGVVREYLRVKNAEELVQAVQACLPVGRKEKQTKKKYFILAGGSNVVFPEKYNGRVIHLISQGSTKGLFLKTQTQGESLFVEARVSLMDFINYEIDQGLAGVETLSGIPGTVGGAIVGNAGAYGQTISDNLVRVKIFNGKKTVWLSKKEGKFTYRESIFKKKGKQDWIVLEAEFDLKPGNKDELKKKSQEIIAVRNERYVPGLKCPGSFFKNVLVKNLFRLGRTKVDPTKIRDGKIPTGYLLEEVGAKGLDFGNLYIAKFHGNLIINKGKATMKEVKKLSNLLKARVFKKFGIKLEEEVRYVG